MADLAAARAKPKQTVSSDQPRPEKSALTLLNELKANLDPELKEKDALEKVNRPKKELEEFFKKECCRDYLFLRIAFVKSLKPDGKEEIPLALLTSELRPVLDLMVTNGIGNCIALAWNMYVQHRMKDIDASRILSSLSGGLEAEIVKSRNDMLQQSWQMLKAFLPSDQTPQLRFILGEVHTGAASSVAVESHVALLYIPSGSLYSKTTEAYILDPARQDVTRFTYDFAAKKKSVYYSSPGCQERGCIFSLTHWDPEANNDRLYKELLADLVTDKFSTEIGLETSTRTC